MNISSTATMVGSACPSYIDHLFNKMGDIYAKHRLENPSSEASTFAPLKIKDLRHS